MRQFLSIFIFSVVFFSSGLALAAQGEVGFMRFTELKDGEFSLQVSSGAARELGLLKNSEFFKCEARLDKLSETLTIDRISCIFKISKDGFQKVYDLLPSSATEPVAGSSPWLSIWNDAEIEGQRKLKLRGTAADELLKILDPKGQRDSKNYTFKNDQVSCSKKRVRRGGFKIRSMALLTFCYILVTPEGDLKAAE